MTAEEALQIIAKIMNEVLDAEKYEERYRLYSRLEILVHDYQNYEVDKFPVASVSVDEYLGLKSTKFY